MIAMLWGTTPAIVSRVTAAHEDEPEPDCEAVLLLVKFIMNGTTVFCNSGVQDFQGYFSQKWLWHHCHSMVAHTHTHAQQTDLYARRRVLAMS